MPGLRGAPGAAQGAAEPLMAMLLEAFEAKGAEVGLEPQSRRRRLSIRRGHEQFPFPGGGHGSRPAPLLISGHEAIALGPGRGSAIYQRLSHDALEQRLERHRPASRKFGVVVEQAEDEIAAINLAIGASYAGSGP